MKAAIFPCEHRKSAQQEDNVHCVAILHSLNLVFSLTAAKRMSLRENVKVLQFFTSPASTRTCATLQVCCLQNYLNGAYSGFFFLDPLIFSTQNTTF